MCWSAVLIVLATLLCNVYCTDLNYLNNVRSFSSDYEQTVAANDLLIRVLGKYYQNVEAWVHSDMIKDGKDTVSIHVQSGLLKAVGGSGVSLSFGINYYLKYHCGFHLSWAENQTASLPEYWPDAYITIETPVRYRYYQNVCTVSYSSVWWDWRRWEQEIDWMALNGINLPLAFTGQEMIWTRVYKKLGCTDEDLDGHFAGPAFLAWGRMGNLHGFGGPLPLSWRKGQLQLQHKILERMKSLGMIPVLPGFAGHIPQAITKLYPKANVSQLSAWSHFNCTHSCTYLLEATDPLFKKIGKMFIAEQIAEYNGTNHIYNADTFNEMIPRSNHTEYLANASRAVFEAMIAADPDAVWLMQGWLFHNAPWFWQAEQTKALLTAVPQGRMLVLDLFSDGYEQFTKTKFFYGQPFIWCMLHDFGGNMGFYGKIDFINTNPLETLLMTNSTMVGTGITPEGINTNYIVYELMLEVGFTLIPVDRNKWITQFVIRRYNSDNEDAIRTWLQLGSDVLNDIQDGFPSKVSKLLIRGPITKRPSLSVAGIPYWYKESSLISAWDSFNQALSHLPDIPTVQYDAVDITRQVLQDLHRIIFYMIVQKADHNKGNNTLGELGGYMMDLMDDMDRILSCNQHFMMGVWINDARNSVDGDDNKDLFEYNARNQVTLWGPRGEILDYACKQWSSLMKYYHKPRWSLFIDHINKAMSTGSRFNDTLFKDDVFKHVEQPFTFDRTPYPTKPTESAVTVAKELYLKWRPFFNYIFKDGN